MTIDIAYARLHAQRLIRPLANPVDVVAHLVAVQSQDFYGATWALAQRSTPTTFDAIDRAYSAGEILRTHVLRPTWHFVTPADARWLLELTGPRVQAKNAFWYKQSGLTAAKLAKTDAAIADALRGGNYLTRDELAKHVPRGVPMTQLMMHAELERVVISGPRRGKVMTYALFDERVPASPALSRDDALALLARRYVTSHGPAQVADFVWWSGLTTADARRALELANLAVHEIDGARYFAAPATKKAAVRDPTVHLLPNYDEYLVAFADRSAAHAKKHEISVLGGNFAFSNGRVIGNWKRGGTKHLDCILSAKPSAKELAALDAASSKLAAFFGLKLQLRTSVDRARTRTGRKP